MKTNKLYPNSIDDTWSINKDISEFEAFQNSFEVQREHMYLGLLSLQVQREHSTR